MNIAAFLPFHPHLGQPVGVRPLPECVAAEDGWTCLRAPGVVTTYATMSGKVSAITTTVEIRPACSQMLSGLLAHKPPVSQGLTAEGATFSWVMGPYDQYLTTFTARGDACDLRLELKP